ncbi:hypothetical protein [Desulfolutivibrio sulfoxidireducens]|uniref:hypothetical protein n=1 Tax=Desulfolutivibrio sulfoxidireducens TaxID=2773299 RepID=UPI00159E3D05|nr:hypothetical protein [Desulfolutivibrio sulfoxidireducens]QLA14683.1 hypothetical protein GD605_00210 [Desulfolutivibrio sulfoxidireducens]QLA18265.1 hypothetical protein GD604_00210 [Desulfolutivibrio sulfoxidireducens]
MNVPIRLELRTAKKRVIPHAAMENQKKQRATHLDFMTEEYRDSSPRQVKTQCVRNITKSLITLGHDLFWRRKGEIGRSPAHDDVIPFARIPGKGQKGGLSKACRDLWAIYVHGPVKHVGIGNQTAFDTIGHGPKGHSSLGALKSGDTGAPKRSPRRVAMSGHVRRKILIGDKNRGPRGDFRGIAAPGTGP